MLGEEPEIWIFSTSS